MDQSERAAVRQALAETGPRLVQLLRRSDPDALVAGSQWRVAEVAAHLGHVFTGFTEAAIGNSAQYARYVPDEQDFHIRLAAVNASLVQELADSAPGGQLGAAITMIEEGVVAFLAATAPLAPDAALYTPWYGLGVTRTTDTLTALALCELLVHGLDIARTVAAPWTIRHAEATVVAPELFARMLPLMLTDAGRAATVSYRISWRGAPRSTPDLVVRFAEGTVAIGPPAPAERVDCRLWVDPVAFLLVGYGRSTTRREVLTGNLLAWGRRPWVATRFPSLFCRP
ncbi:maleylpyruvate isomerase N-terminal domain-containing protein [Kitasatospora kifunensis]|uniref:Mycothiol-dependent maleylpyruvate isomerase metal-binding domain-containing protein n=1 Tax=Kitasatospora kifunensis TaxID=58351 RepID=A0A7W7QYK0_KITKI|nr:maleylpyruvate isomerase N-terminal domain-containing protein [Kitasatospora kifunensis]MBB4922059.1 hypothetical protein [Kitasatospora kifunensis]